MDKDLKTQKLLIIVESPNKVKTITDILKKAGYNARVMASIGHVMELANSGNYYNTGVDPKNNFEMDIEIDPDKKDTVKKLKAQVDWADLVYLMSDPDREGYVISWSLIKFLKLSKNKYRRAVTHEITPKAVVHAIENPVPMDDNLVEAGLARLALDKMMGYRLSNVVKTYVGAKSAGRCQSVGLKIIADREREIQNFIPETYIDLYLNFQKNSTKFKAKFIGSDQLGNVDHLTNQKEVDSIVALCTDEYVIQGIDKKEKQEAPKPPFCTATFQQEVASKLNLSIQNAMAIAQKLFEGIDINGEHKALITYMRTDDTEFAPEFIPELKNYIVNTFGKEKYVAPRKGKKQETDQQGHECLRCIDPTLTPELLSKYISNDLQLKVYKIIWQRTIAACLPNAVYSETGYLIDNNGQKFLLTSKELLEEGYKIIYNYKDEDDSKDSTIVKETFEKGEVLSIINEA